MRWSQERRGRVAVLAAIVLAAVTACAAPASTSAVASSTGGGVTLGSSTPAADRGATDTEVTFESAGVTVHGTLRRPASGGAAVPAVVLLAGSGPTDRNGDSKVSAGSIGTLSWLADQFAAEGVASLRYDKLGTGATGMADFARHPNDVGFDVFVGEARDALAFLAAQPGIDATKLVIAGHSEGGLIALVVATDPGSAPAPVAQALFSPPTGRYLDLLRADRKIDRELMAG